MYGVLFGVSVLWFDFTRINWGSYQFPLSGTPPDPRYPQIHQVVNHGSVLEYKSIHEPHITAISEPRIVAVKYHSCYIPGICLSMCFIWMDIVQLNLLKQQCIICRNFWSLSNNIVCFICVDLYWLSFLIIDSWRETMP